ncbi:AAA family ATPase [Actinomycetospora sp. CA-053990]|uniref:polysaccharide biosynthesis tyrosine autokinase n=1 Tax=Actinomycetospora sp. CA-053990 TaxID=3239891 RepID=UPI003D8C189F
MEADRNFAASETLSGPDRDSNWVGGPGLVASLWRYRLIIVVVTASAAVAGLALSLLLPARYEAKASLYLRDPGSPAVLTLDGSQSQSGDHAVFMATQAALAGSDTVAERALQLLNRRGTPDDLRRSVVVEPSADLASITISATSGNPADATDLANAVGTAYEQVARERTAADSKEAVAQLQQVLNQRSTEFDVLRAQAAQASGSAASSLERKAQHVADLIGSLQVRQDEIAAQAALYGSGVESFEQAVPPVSSSEPAPALLALLGAAFGLVGAGGWAWWAAGRDRRVDAESDATAILGIPLLGEMPKLGVQLPRRGEPSSPPDEVNPSDAEAYHFVLGSLDRALARVGGKVIAVASARPGDGKTVTVLNLALAVKRESRKVLLVDADEHTRRLSDLCCEDEHFKVLGVTRDGDKCAAFTEEVALGGQGSTTVELSDAVLQIGPSEQNGQHPAVFFRSTAFGKLIISASEHTDLVLIDTPSLLDVSEAVTISDQADAVLLVVSRGTSLADLRRARDRLALTDTPLIGYLLNHGSPQRADVGRRTGRRGLSWGLLRRGRPEERVPQKASAG